MDLSGGVGSSGTGDASAPAVAARVQGDTLLTPWIVTMAARAGSVRFGKLRYLPPSTFLRP